MFQDIADPPLPVPAPKSVEPSWANTSSWNCRNVCRSVVCHAHATDAPVVASTAPTPRLVALGSPGAPLLSRLKNPPRMTRVPLGLTATARTSALVPRLFVITGAHAGMSVPVVASTSAANGRGVVNAPPTYRFPAGDTASPRTALFGRSELPNPATGAPLVPFTSTRFLWLAPFTVVNVPPR